MTIDITKYINGNGFINLNTLLREQGFVPAEEVMATRLDTVAIAQLLKMNLKTLRNYVSLGLVQLGPDRRMPLREVLELDHGILKQEAKLQKEVSHKRQNRSRNG